MIPGEWIEIRFQRPDGSLGSHYVMVDSQGCFFWNPPEAIVGVYFRTPNRAIDDGCVQMVGLRLWVPLWTPDEIANFKPVKIQPGGQIDGHVYRSAALRLPAVNDFKLLDPIPFEPPKIEDKDESVDKIPAAVLEKIRKNLTKQQQSPKRLFRIFHRRRKADF